MNSVATASRRARADSGLRTRPAPASFSESTAWKTIGADWRQLCGSFDDAGVSIEWHQFQFRGAFDWARSFHSQSLEICINLSGTGTIRSPLRGLNLQPVSIAFYATGNKGLEASRQSGQPHQFITIEFSVDFLRERLSKCDGALHPVVEEFIRNPRLAEIGASHQLTPEQERLAVQLRQPPVVIGARSLWYESKVLELISGLFFERPVQDELFCERQKRVARERVDRVIVLLRQRLADPPSLDEISRAVGCSSFHLSRTFSQQMGLTIPQYLRKLRIERAAELLRSGKHNVTEAAFEVGYSSLSHFSQAFCQLMGCCPALYPSTKNSTR